MPKKTRDFPANLNFNVALEIRQILTALSYLRGSGGSFAPAARDLLAEGIRVARESMSERKRRDFEEILKTIKERDKVLENPGKPSGIYNKKTPP